MRRLLTALLVGTALAGCGDEAPDEPAEATPAAEVTPSPPPSSGFRSIDRARGVAASASDRALQHDTIR